MKQVYFNGQIISENEARISPEDRGFLFADGVYEVIRVYRGKLFKAEEHLIRLKQSLDAISMHIAMPDFKEIASQLLSENQLEEATVYIQITRGAAPRKHVFPEPDVQPTIYVSASPFASDPQKWQNGVRAILVPDIRWVRCNIKTIGLLPNVLANQTAKENSAEEALFVRDGAITEGSHTNFCAVINSEFRTYPESSYILSGITRKIVIELCKSLDIPVRENQVFENDLKYLQEAMLLGTTTEIMPIIRINDGQIGDGRPGPITLKLQKAFQELVNAD